jgi:hypothetical protein
MGIYAEKIDVSGAVLECTEIHHFFLGWMSFVWQGALQSAHMHSLVRFGWELISVVNGKNWYKQKHVL